MASFIRKAPLTPLDALRVLLGEYADGDPTFPAKLTQMVQKLKKQALPELGGRLSPGVSPRGLRKAILGCIAKFDWPEWVPWILKGLLLEPDLGVFDDGCAALGAIGTRNCLEGLRTLQGHRLDPNHQVILTRELGQFQAQQGLSYYLGRLREGQGNPRLAAQASKLLCAIAQEEDLPDLTAAHLDGDPLTRRLVIRVLGSMASPAALDFLLELIETTRQDLLDHQALLSQLNRLHTLPRASTLPELVRQAAARFESRAPEAVAELHQATAQEGGNAAPALEALRPGAQGVYEQFLLDALTLVTEGKTARYSAMIAEASPATEARLAELGLQCDQVAETLAFAVDSGALTLDQVLPPFAGILRARAGGEGFIHAFLRLLPASETGVLDELLADPDPARRAQYLNALGTREDDALTPFFVKALRDSIVDVGQLAIHHLGKLPSSFPIMMGMFQDGNADQVRLAIWAFKENHTLKAAQPLLEFIKAEGHDSLLEEAVEAVAAIGIPESAATLLELLHDGKPLNLQVALALALKQLGTEEAALGLLARAAALKQPSVLILALEGALSAFPGYDHPLPLDQLPAFLQLLDRCCDDREGEGQRLRAVLATQDLYVFDRQTYEKLKERFSDYLFDMRTKEAWDRDSNDRVAAVVKELGRRGEGLGLLAQKETAIQGQMQWLPPNGPKRVEALLALRETLQDPNLIVRPRLAQALATLVADQLQKPAAEWRETAHLCEIGGLTRQMELLVDPIREVYQKATGLGLKSAARTALLALGLEEQDLNRRAPIRSILLLEPSGFFRKRLATALAAAGSWELAQAGSRQEAETVLADHPVDLVLTESKDAEGDLCAWLEQQWSQNRCRHAIVSTSSRDIGDLAQTPWVISILFKPYPLEQVIQALEG
ncbi:MAG: HEAT repeat domain-containing protein [Holophaga sp.]|nr:HEAT repeat domain-containing protein [Holophaga sp.]